MTKFNILIGHQYRLLSITLFSACILAGFFSSIFLRAQDYGGFTDPKNPGRHSRLNIDSANIVVKPHGIYAEITTEFWYRPTELTSSYDTLELYAHFKLPVSDFINDSWLWVEDTLVHAMIIDVNAASLIYEDIVNRQHRDPSILYRRSTSGQYEYRIFPNVGNKSRHAKISYYTKMKYADGLAQFTFTPTILNLSDNKSIPRHFKFYLNNNFTDIKLSSDDFHKYYSQDKNGRFVEFRTQYSYLNQIFSYEYDFSTPYFSKSKRIDDQEYYFTMFDSKVFVSDYINQKINFLIDYDINRTTVAPDEMIEQLKAAILNNFSSNDSINIMIGNKEIINLFDRWVPCHKDTIESLLNPSVYKQIGYYSYLADLLEDGIEFNAKYNSNSSIILLTSSEYAPTPPSANPIIEKCLQLMSQRMFKITSIDFSDIHYSQYNINNETYYGNQYFNEKIAEMTKSDNYSIKYSYSNNYSSLLDMLNASFRGQKGAISDVGLYVEPAEGITFAKTTENIIDKNGNKNLIYEYGKIEGTYPIEVKYSALFDGKPVIRKIVYDDSINTNNESAKMWNWKYLRVLEDKYNKTIKEINDLTVRSITNRILTTQTAFLCLEPWMMGKDTTIDDEEEDVSSSVQEYTPEIGLEVTYGPVPVASNMHIKINITNENTEVLFIGIYDVLGSVVKEFHFDTLADSIDLDWDTYSDSQSKVPPGVYYLVIKTTSGSRTLKIVVV